MAAFGLSMLSNFSVNWKLGNVNLKSVNVPLLKLVSPCVCEECRIAIMEYVV